MSDVFNFDDVATESKTINFPDLETNRLATKKIIETNANKLPVGMRMYISGDSFGVSYKHPLNATGFKTSDSVKMNQPYKDFASQANSVCAYFYNLSSKTNKKFNVKPKENT